ncbi:MAG TPA: dihydropteroate synthase [Solirubrobacterales bacterium]|nr:dihydropteroate synthase [Solirubrobacterales bacterium]
MSSSLLKARGLTLDASRPLVVGIVNATTDSFSGSGERSSASWIEDALKSYEAGAAIVEVGGESNVSNRPPVPPALEAERVVAVVEALVAAGATVAVDTHRVATARAALAAGAAFVNDISGLADPAMVELCAETGAGVVLMHTETPPKTPLWDDELYPDGVTARLLEFFDQRLRALADAGVSRDHVVLDPGPDFAKTPRQTVGALRELDQLTRFGCPLMLAVSRKDFIGALSGRPPRERGAGTFAALAAGLRRGARLLRVHDVEGTIDFLRIWEALEEGVEVPVDLRIEETVRREAAADSLDPA